MPSYVILYRMTPEGARALRDTVKRAGQVRQQNARRGFKIRPVWVRVRCGRPLTFPHVQNPSPRLAEEVTARLWPCVELQWNWLGGDQVEPLEHVQEQRAA